ncbi:platelet endothelial cell adhesion molecule isoform X3 [Engraulis encrasicolus]|uniref:platelet endothelial cell adhesion molecule isoform X3 n=1 Tax=Engraulis encrasicolus TaxID=184585 RepID=UPI002FD3C033
MWDRKRPSHSMGTCHHLNFLLLFTCLVRVKADVSVDNVHVSFEPSHSVGRATQVTVICHADISRGQSFPEVEFSIVKDNQVVMNTTNEDSWEYPIASARVSDIGTYKCLWSTLGKKGSSDGGELKVTGMAKPTLHLDKRSIQEGDEVKAMCSARGESGEFVFFFFLDNKQVHKDQAKSSSYDATLQLKKSGTNKLTCRYNVRLLSEDVKSNESEAIIVVVREINVQVSLNITPSKTVFEVDAFRVSCEVSPQMFDVTLMKGGTILSSRPNRTEHRSTGAVTGDAGEYMCKVEVNGVSKIAKETLTVKELFSAPTLTSEPKEPFQGDWVQLICLSTNISVERTREVRYSIFRNGNPLPMGNQPDRLGVRAGPDTDGNYTCSAEAKSLSKKSPVIVFKSKVLASKPQISVKGTVILGHNFQIKCNSSGTLPINYTLYRANASLGTQSVARAGQEALFTTAISSREHIGSFWCRAQNSGARKHIDGSRLNAFVVEPLSKPLLTTLPVPEDVEEGKELILICNVQSGSPPITFKWFFAGGASSGGGGRPHLHTGTVDTNFSNHTIQWLEMKDSGEYYCEASNPANKATSERIAIRVRLATWKKGLIVIVCLLVVAALVVAVIVRYKAKRASVNVGTSVWTTDRPSSSDSSDRSSVHSQHGPEVEYTEVVHPQPVDPARVPLKKGTDTVYSELQTGPQDPSEHVDNGAVEYAELNHDLPELPEPVD